MSDFKKMSTFDLAFNLATGAYNEKEKFEALSVIKSREPKTNLIPGQTDTEGVVSQPNKAVNKKPLKGSKAEKIQLMIDEGKSAKEIFDNLRASGVVVYYPEIYRLINKGL